MGPESNANERIVLQAARWYARLAAHDCTPEERAEFERWRQRDRAHAEVFAATEAFSDCLGRAGTLDDRFRAMADEAFELGANESFDDEAAESVSHGPRGSCIRNDASSRRVVNVRRRRWYVPAAIAASIVVTFVSVRMSGLGEPSPIPAVTYTAPADARRDITLSDGSVVHLDVSSEISVRMSPGRRDIVLIDGRALFDVARDKRRPFTVAAGHSRTTALGTRFQVQREGQRVLVTLAEGSIAVTGEAGSAKPWSEKLIPGEQISVTADSGHGALRIVDTQAVTSWSHGRLVFRGTPLAEAIEEVNRYADRKIRLGDPELARIPVGGNFIAGETDLIVSAFAAALPLRVVDGGAGEIILFRRYQADAD
jgi:transmembrane sensor